MRLFRATLLTLMVASAAFAARGNGAGAGNAAITAFGVTAGGAAGRGMTLSAPMQVALGLTLLTLLPAAIMCITPFLRITIVLHFLRQALGTQTAPSNQVLLGLSLFLSMLVVQPMFSEIYSKAWQPLEDGKITKEQAMDQGAAPLRTFLLRFAREKDMNSLSICVKSRPRTTRRTLVLKVLIPAYILSELKAGFQIGAVLFLPFLVIDIVVASVTLSIGMMQLPPAMISAPFKILLFVLVDGWNLVVGSLMKSFLDDNMNPQFGRPPRWASADGRLLDCAPLLIISFVLSIVINLIQIATSMQDPASVRCRAWGPVCWVYPADALDDSSRPDYATLFFVIWASLQNELTLPVGTLLGFALYCFALAACLFLCRFHRRNRAHLQRALPWPWPRLSPCFHDGPWRSSFELSTMVLWMFSELALGICIGLAVSFIAEAIVFGAQALGLQAGYGYASVVDPTTQSRFNVLPVLANLCAGLLFFTTGRIAW